MADAFVTVLPVTLAVVLLASAIAKLRTPDDLVGWAELGVPGPLRRQVLLRLHPWGELALALGLLVLGGFLGLILALVATVLMTGYLWLVARAFRESRASGEDASCSCFGARRQITRVTVARNAWLTLLALATASIIWTVPLVGGAIFVGVSNWAWLVATAAAAFTTALVLWPDSATDDSPGPVRSAPAFADSLADADELDYVRTRTPAVPLQLANGTTVNLRRLASSRPTMLFSVSEACGGCEPVVARLPVWRTLLPEVDLRLLLASEPDAAAWTEYSEPQSLHDPQGYVRGSIADWPTPTVVLLGIDGLLAGGPVSGATEIESFISDVHESLHGVVAEPQADDEVAAAP